MYIFDLGRLGELARGLGILVIAALANGSGLAGFAPSEAQAEEYLGEIVLMANRFCPRGTIEANGRSLGNNGALNMFNDGNPFVLPDLRDSGSMRWCVVESGIIPPRGSGSNRSDDRMPGEIVAFVTGYCMEGWEIQTAATLPYQDSITWCKALENGYAGDDSHYYLAQMQLGSGDGCLTSLAVPADGRAFIAMENEKLWTLLSNAYGGDSRSNGEGSFNVPDLASPAPGMTWCINNGGYYPPHN
ncbi:phage tail collar family protein [Hoeflea sp. IMCC20628]|uniref:tail fiber protein n=1 Tax=Hoeflea sp. IMCC20628 TaxID=1620421 RepID=UPI00063AEC0B|nr:tail fiber protein [Hoeflea sp. IMCC20628]AKI00839.1 phage tail collar family protein [Hoeflea sp. IMCC20628]